MLDILFLVIGATISVSGIIIGLIISEIIINKLKNN